MFLNVVLGWRSRDCLGEYFATYLLNSQRYCYKTLKLTQFCNFAFISATLATF